MTGVEKFKTLRQYLKQITKNKILVKSLNDNKFKISRNRLRSRQTTYQNHLVDLFPSNRCFTLTDVIIKIPVFGFTSQIQLLFRRFQIPVETCPFVQSVNAKQMTSIVKIDLFCDSALSWVQNWVVNKSRCNIGKVNQKLNLKSK